MTRQAAVSLLFLPLIALLIGCADGGASRGAGQPDRKAEAEALLAFEEAQAECMGEKGFPATFHEDGARTFSGSGALAREELLALLDECSTIVGGEPETQPVTDLEKAKLYDLEMEAYECLLELGYEPDPPPTREHYVESFDMGPPWFSHSNSDQLVLPTDVCPPPKLADIEW